MADVSLRKRVVCILMAAALFAVLAGGCQANKEPSAPVPEAERPAKEADEAERLPEAEENADGEEDTDKRQEAWELLDALFEKLEGSAVGASNPGAYLEAEPEAFEEIVEMGNAALAYCFEQFEEGGQTGLRGSLMAEACKAVTGRQDTDAFVSDGQAWYENLKEESQKMAARMGYDEVIKYQSLEGALLRFLDGDMEDYSREIYLPDYMYLGADKALCLLYETERERANEEEEGFHVWAIRVHGDHSYEESDGELMRWKLVATVHTGNYRLLGDRVWDIGGSVVPVAVTYESRDGGKTYELFSYEQAGDGSGFLPSIEAFCTMPISGEKIPGLAQEVLDLYGDDLELTGLLEENLREHLARNGQEGKELHLSGLPPA